MKVLYNEGKVMCREHYHCPYENCKHYSWHPKKESCKSRRCQKIRQMVSCTPTPIEK
ncbi:MAG: hypothetical protein KO318_00955 [Methanobacterium sp.]|uniref:hypothetical protein n=1 Tax=Methanobacterium sp. TaxID=2164 RepID=UPI002584EA25|nr:hypothetical protein [Methanobacterium sp.]MCC7558987.1 hypothetical protein [Methanobacterium sp.]